MTLHGRSDPGRGSATPRYPGSFLLAFREAAANLGWHGSRWMGDMVECAGPDGRHHVVGLENIYRRCKRAERQSWPTMIKDFLQSVEVVDQDPGLPEDLQGVADRLLPRLGHPLKPVPPHASPTSTGEVGGDARVWSQSLPGTHLCVNLVIDYANRMCYVTDKLVGESSVSGKEWLDRALANLLARTPAACLQKIHEESGLLLCNVADAYDSSRALLLEKLLPEARAEGYLIVLPGRDELLVLPVTRQAIPHVHLLKKLAQKNFKTAPYPISDEVFWVRQGEWRLFSVELRTNEVAIHPPEGFVEVLNRLLPPQQQTQSEPSA